MKYEIIAGFEPSFGGGFWIVLFVAFIAGIASFIFWLLMLLHAFKYNSPDRTIWIIAMIAGLVMGFHLIVAIIYWFVEKENAEHAGLFGEANQVVASNENQNNDAKSSQNQVDVPNIQNTNQNATIISPNSAEQVNSQSDDSLIAEPSADNPSTNKDEDPGLIDQPNELDDSSQNNNQPTAVIRNPQNINEVPKNTENTNQIN